MAIRRKKFRRIKFDRVHLFKLKAWNASGTSEWTDQLPIKTSAELGIYWASGANINAKTALFWNRTIKIFWSPIVGTATKLDYYLLFKKDRGLNGVGAGASLAEINQSIIDGEDSIYFVENTNKRRIHFDKDIEAEHVYDYWVWGIDRFGNASNNFLGPDRGEWGEPEIPKIRRGLMEADPSTTIIHDVNKWWCDVRVIWQCVGGAEGYWIQRRQRKTGISLNDNWLGYQKVYVEHDEEREQQLFNQFGEHDLQDAILHNFICDKTYEFRARAVNVPITLVSDWSSGQWYTTLKDTTPPDPVDNVDARRFFWYNFQKGDYIKVNWTVPKNPIIREQIDFYEVWRKAGTNSEADTYAAAINALIDTNPALYPVSTRPISETKSFLGTQFIDDNIEGLPSTSGVLGWNTQWTVEGADDTARRTAIVGAGTKVGTITGTAAPDTSKKASGSYSFHVPSANANNRILFDDSASPTMVNPNEGYVQLYVYCDWSASPFLGQAEIFRLEANASRLINFVVGAAGFLTFQRVYGTNVSIFWTVGEMTPFDNTWVKIELQWSQTNDWVRGKVEGLDSDWRYNAFGTVGTWNTGVYPVNSIYIGKQIGSTTELWIDDFNLHNNLVVPELDEFYHYFVRAVDVYGYKSLVQGPGDTLTPSYDKVSFGPPEQPVLISPTVLDQAGAFNVTVNFFGSLAYSIRMTWTSIEEAVWYRVRIKFDPKGDWWTWTRWHYSARLEESRIVNEDGNPEYIYPFPIAGETDLQWGVEAINRAGSVGFVDSGVITVNNDSNPPDKVTGLTGECFGMLWGEQQLWLSCKLRWTTLPKWQGVKNYQIYRYQPTHPEADGDGYINVGQAIGAVPPFKSSFVDIAAPSGGQNTYRVSALDKSNDLEGEYSDPLTVPFEYWWWP